MTTEVEPTAGPGPADRRQRLAEALRARRDAPARLAPNQERLWFLQQLDPASVAYAETVVLRLSGPLDVVALETAVGGLAGRHEWLRSRVLPGPDGPVQSVAARLTPEIVHADLAAGVDRDAAVTGTDLDPAALSWVRSLAEQPFSLAEGPLWRAGLGRWSAEDHLLVLVVHHIACDASSLAVLIDEVGARYDALVGGPPGEWATPRSARDLAQAVRTLQGSPAVGEAVDVQANALLDADLDARFGAPGDRPGRAAVAVRDVPAELAGRVRRMAAQHDVAPFAVVGTAIGLAIAQELDIETPVLGVPVDLRWRFDGGEDVVAFLVETVAVPLPAVLDTPPARVLAGIRAAVAGALQQPAPFEQVVDRVRQLGGLPGSAAPLHAYVTWLDGGESTTLGSLGPVVTHLDPPLGEAKADLVWTVVDRETDIRLRLEYDSEHVGRETAERVLSETARLLDLISRSPDTPVSAGDRVDATDLARLLAWEGSLAEEPDTDLVTAVRRGLERQEGPVLVSGNTRWSGPDLLGRVEALARSLRAAGVGPGVRVAVSSRRVPGMVVSLLAVLRAGGTFLPIDHAHPRSRQSDLVRWAQATVVVGEHQWAVDLAADTGVTAVPTDDEGTPRNAVPQDGGGWPGRSPGDLAYVLFTSGSTGRPKGVRVPDGAVVARVASYRAVLADDDEDVRYLLHSSLTFDASVYLFWVLAVGGCLVLADDRQAADPLALAGLVQHHRVTDSFFVPALYEAVLRVAAPGALASCRRLCVGGDVMPPAVAELHLATLPETALLNVYGPTETVVTATAARVTAADVARHGRVPIGTPHPGTLARVLDRHGRRVPVGVPGELHLGGPSVAEGYDSAGAVASGGPFRSEQTENGRTVRWYATGDVVTWSPDGQLEYVGRRDRQVKLRGQRVELGEVEGVARALPGVRDAAVELLDGPTARHLVLFVEPVTPGVRESLAERLPAAWLPEAVVTREALPRLPSGKLDRAALRAEQLPSSTGGAPAPAGVDGITRWGLGPAVLSIVRSVLDRQDVGPDDDFFAVGGNSLLAARLMGQLSAALGVRIPLERLLAGSTVREITALVDETVGTEATTGSPEVRLVAVRESGSLPPVVLITRDGETSLVLRHFMAQLDRRRPLWALVRPMPPLGHEVPDLRATGRLAAAALTEHFPEGPLVVLGHSASGVVALEATRCLGPDRGRAILLDSIAPPAWAATPLRHVAAAGALVHERAVLAHRRVRPPAAGDPTPPSSTLHALRQYQDRQAVLRLRMRAVDFPVTVVVADETRVDSGSEDLGWRRWAPQVRVLSVPGDHISLLMHPAVERTIERIEEALRTWE